MQIPCYTKQEAEAALEISKNCAHKSYWDGKKRMRLIDVFAMKLPGSIQVRGKSQDPYTIYFRFEGGRLIDIVEFTGYNGIVCEMPKHVYAIPLNE